MYPGHPQPQPGPHQPPPPRPQPQPPRHPPPQPPCQPFPPCQPLFMPALWKPADVLPKDLPPPKDEPPCTFSGPPSLGEFILPAEPKCELLRLVLPKRDPENPALPREPTDAELPK